MGYLELPQVRAPNGGRLVLTKELLETRGVYILDCYSDIFVWIGRKSTRLVRTAALKLSSSLEAMINRPPYTLVTSTLEGTESQIFKSKFEGWDDLIPVDYTRTADSVYKKASNYKKQQQQKQEQQQQQQQREGSVDSVASSASIASSSTANILSAPNSSLLRAQSVAPLSSTGTSASSSILRPPSEPLKTDLVALFKDRYVPVSDEDALGMMEEINDFLESMECFVFENKKFVRLPEREFAQFYSEDSYLFVCRYWKLDETESNGGSVEKEGEDGEQQDEALSGEGSIELKLFFWQGRDANNAGWLTYTFTLKKKFKVAY